MNQMWAAILNNLPAILTALASLIGACVSAYVAIKQAQTHTAVMDLTDKINGNGDHK